MTEIIISTAGYVFLTIIALTILVAVYGFVILPILETFSLCRCWRKAYGPQPWKDWPRLLRIAFSYAYDHASSACITGYHAYNWNWEGVGRWTVTKLYPYGCIKERTHWEPDIFKLSGCQRSGGFLKWISSF